MKRILEIVLSLVVAIALCFLLKYFYDTSLIQVKEFLPPFLPFLVGIIFGLIFYIILSSVVARYILQKMSILEDKLVKMSVKDLMSSLIGIVIGLVIANLMGMALNGFGPIGTAVVILFNVIFGFLGFRVAQKKKDELNFPSFRSEKVEKGKKAYGKPKILDTSVIIDGRILDLLQTGFIEGKIVIPNFVLEELRHIADSSDSLKRNRGRRGLDILNEIQKQLSVPVEIIDFNTKEQLEVDSKLLKMAEKLDAFVVTNDFNLNKVAEFQGVQVLNINELANAIKPVVLPGEVMRVTIIKAGKENNQGIGYLNDGTMIVVEGGQKHIGITLDVIVTSVLQTAAGRMIFTKLKED